MVKTNNVSFGAKFYVPLHIYQNLTKIEKETIKQAEKETQDIPGKVIVLYKRTEEGFSPWSNKKQYSDYISGWLLPKIKANPIGLFFMEGLPDGLISLKMNSQCAKKALKNNDLFLFRDPNNDIVGRLEKKPSFPITLDSLKDLVTDVLDKNKKHKKL